MMVAIKARRLSEEEVQVQRSDGWCSDGDAFKKYFKLYDTLDMLSKKIKIPMNKPKSLNRREKVDY